MGKVTKWSNVRNFLVLMSLISLATPVFSSKQIFFCEFFDRRVCLYFWVIIQAVLSFIYTKKFNSKWSILWGIELIVWGLTISSNPYYETMSFFYYLGLAPLIIYCLAATYYIQKEKCIVQENTNREMRYRKLEAAFMAIAYSSVMFSLFACALNDAISSRDERLHAIFWAIGIGIVSCLFAGILCLVEYFLKNYLKDYLKIYEAITVAVVLLNILFAVIPACVGFGWNFAVLVGVPFGFLAYYSMKKHKEELIAKMKD